MKTKYLISILVAAILGGFISVGIYKLVEQAPADKKTSISKQQAPYKFTNYTSVPKSDTQHQGLDFTFAAKRSTPAVVHIKSSYLPNQYQQYNDFYRRFFGEHFGHPYRRRQPQQQAGSGVIISPDGYIVTNYHVVKSADEIEVILHDKRSYSANVIGTAPSTDLALLKIDEDQLPFVTFGNADQVNVGEWVLAVGNPFNLTSTVTAGIVSAKGRNLNILKDQWSIESFIQTDAAVNPGNSGGALVNLNGELIGINTAIATPTGAYAGYAFAIPVNIVEKVVNDLKKYGVVQRGYLGVVIRNLNGQLSEKLSIDQSKGVYVDSLIPGGAALEAGVQPGDVIVAVEEQAVANVSELQEEIVMHRPGDNVTLTVLRNGEKISIDAVLKNKEGTMELVNQERQKLLHELGIDLRELSEKEQEKLNIEGGIRVTNVKNGLMRKYTDIQKGFIITKVNNEPVFSVDDFIEKLKNKKGNGKKEGVLVEGIYPNYSGVFYYGFSI